MDESTQDAIKRLMLEIAEARQQVKTIKEHAEQVLEQNDEYREVKEQLKELTTKRAEAKKILQADKDYQAVASELEEQKFKLKDLQEIMSHHLVAFYSETQQTQIRDDQGEVYQINLSAKIGRPEVITEPASPSA